ncbi:response regulator [Methylosoma difficile]
MVKANLFTKPNAFQIAMAKRKGPILCVDDESTNLALLHEVLKTDYSLVYARNGEEALQAINKHQPILILLDIHMPHMDGYQVCQQIKANPLTKDTPVIFVTALHEKANEEVGFSVGCVDYITKPISPAIVQARVRTHLSLVSTEKLETSYLDAIHILSEASRFKDADTGAHIWRTAAYCRLLAETIGWPKEQCELLELAAPMHDIGKIGIADTILKKTGKYSPEEYEAMKAHAQIGYEILRCSHAPVFVLAAEIALHHHEHWDGSGYPQGLSGTDIPEAARITAIADVFDALSAKRSYKEVWSIEKIVAFFKESAGIHFEPRLVEAFLESLPNLLEQKHYWDNQE